MKKSVIEALKSSEPHDHTTAELRIYALQTVTELQRKCRFLTYGDVMSIANFLTTWSQARLVEAAVRNRTSVTDDMSDLLKQVDVKDLPRA